MKAALKSADLSAALARLKMLISRKTTLPVLGGVLIEATEGELALTGTDLDTFLTLRIPAEVEEPGEIVATCARLQAAVDKIEGEELSLATSGKGHLIGEAGTMRFDLIGLAASDFPPRSKMPEASPMHFEQGVISSAIGREISSASDDQSRYVLCGIYLTAHEGKMQMVATDGRRLALTQLDTLSDGLNVIVPTDAAKLMACLDDGGATALLIDQNQIWASGKGWTMVSKLIEGEFPNWRQVMPPAGASHRFKIGREQLMEAVAFVATVCTSKAGTIKLELAKGEVTVSADTPDVGHTDAEIKAEVHGKQLSVGFNHALLSAALAVCEGDTVTGEIDSEISPLRLTDDKTVHVLMPMRIS